MTIFVTAFAVPLRSRIPGYEVAALADTLAKTGAAGVQILMPPYDCDYRRAAMLEFPGGYIAEVHSPKAAPSPAAAP
jgi:hypothetical protein